MWPEFLRFMLEQLVRCDCNAHLFARLLEPDSIAQLGKLATACKAFSLIVWHLVTPVRRLCDEVLDRFITPQSGLMRGLRYRLPVEREFDNEAQVRYEVEFAEYDDNHTLTQTFGVTYERDLQVYVHPLYMEVQLWAFGQHFMTTIPAELITLTPRFDAAGRCSVKMRKDETFCFRQFESLEELVELVRSGELARPPRHVRDVEPYHVHP